MLSDVYYEYPDVDPRGFEIKVDSSRVNKLQGFWNMKITGPIKIKRLTYQ